MHTTNSGREAQTTNRTSNRLFSPLLPRYAVLPVVLMLAANSAAFYGTRLLDIHAPLCSVSTALDARIPFVPAMIVVYLLAFVQWGAGYLVLAHEPRELCRYWAGAMLLAKLIGAACFLFIPTVIERPVPAGADIFSRLTAWIYSIDPPNNLFPSFHCLESWLFTRLFLASPRVRRSWKIASVIFTLAVFASVLLLKQHYVADVPAGIATAELGMLWSRLFFDKKEPTE